MLYNNLYYSLDIGSVVNTKSYMAIFSDPLLTSESGGLNPHKLHTSVLHCVQVLWLGGSLLLILSSVVLHTGQRDLATAFD